MSLIVRVISLVRNTACSRIKSKMSGIYSKREVTYRICIFCEFKSTADLFILFRHQGEVSSWLFETTLTVMLLVCGQQQVLITLNEFNTFNIT